MNWFAKLKEMEDAPAATLQKLQKVVSVVSVGSLPGHVENPGGVNTACSHAGKCGNDAENKREIHTARVALCAGRDVSLDEAQWIAEKLERRDAEHDERILCLECTHLYGNINARRCSQWRQAGNGSASLPADLVTTLQRCSGFQRRLHPATHT